MARTRIASYSRFKTDMDSATMRMLRGQIAARLYHAGVPAAKSADLFNVSTPTIVKDLRDIGVRVRPRGRANKTTRRKVRQYLYSFLGSDITKKKL